MELKTVQELTCAIREVLGEAGRVTYYLQRQQFWKGSVHGIQLIENLSSCMDLLIPALPEINGEDPIADVDGLLLMLQEIQEAQENSDYVLLSDLYGLKLVPVFSRLEERLVASLGISIDEDLVWKNIQYCQEYDPQLLMSLFPDAVLCEARENRVFSDEVIDLLVGMVEKALQKGYSIEHTSSGFLTLAVCEEGHNFYFHTNGQIVQEALCQAQEWLAQEKEEYTFYGLGFTYPYLEMLSEDQNISIRVVEMNRDLLFLAAVFAPIWRLYESGRFSLVYDPTGHRLEKMDLGVDGTKGFYIYYPALRGIMKQHIRQQMENFFVEESSIREQKRQLDGNFRKNSKASYGSMEDLRDCLQGKDVIIVAAGPSLDNNIQLLKGKRGETVVIAVGTVLRKLLAEGIRPDFVIIIDAGVNVYRQIQGQEKCGVPLIFLSTVFSGIVRDYQSKKYLLCQNGYQPARELAGMNGWETVETGGSVVTAAFDLCLRLHASRIIFVGLDMAYTRDLYHASDTDFSTKVIRETGIWVEGIDGKKVKTSKNLKIYKDWLEHRMEHRSEEEKKVAVIDATEGGAKKRGMKIMTLQAALGQGKI